MRIQDWIHKNRDFAPRRLLMVWVSVAVLMLIPVSPLGAQSDISFTAVVDKTKLDVDDVLNLELTLTGAVHNADQPEMPQLEDFYVISSSNSSQFSIINNQISSRVIYSYQLRPVRTGTLTIPPVSIQVGRESYTTQAVTVEVVAGSAPAPSTSVPLKPESTAEAPEALANQDFFVEAEVDKADPYISQQIIYTFRLYQRLNFASQPRLDWPEFTGFLGY
ncbi:MAG: BatD family protein, partial [Anaerolineae bacterium]|nr:BatD family protein [Anaerolineae bacterium]